MMKEQKCCLHDATKGAINMKGYALLRWNKRPSGFYEYSVQLSEEVVDQILEWRDASIASNTTERLLEALKECVTDKGAYCFQDNDASEMLDAMERRLDYISMVAGVAISETEK